MPTRVISRSSLREAKLQATIHEMPAEATDVFQSEQEISRGSEKVQGTKSAVVDAVQSEEKYVVDLSAWRVVLLVYSLLTGLFLSIMDTSIVSTATYAVAQDINGGIGETTWILLAYTLTYLGFSVIIARFSDVLGRKYTVLTCFTVFITMSIGCGCARNLHQLILFRALQGVGGAGLYALSMVVLPEITPLKLLPVTSTFIGMTVAISGVLGPILGGVIAESTTWRWIFWLNVPVAGFSAVLFFIACPSTVRGFELSKQKLSNIDYIGCMLMLGFSVMLVFGLQQAGIGAFSWSSPTVICTITFGILSGFALIIWQFWLAKTSVIDVAMIMPIRVMKDRVLLSGILSTLCTGYSHLLVLFNLPFRFQIVNLDNPKMAGIHIIPFLGAVAFGSTFGGGASAKENRTFFTFMLAATFILVGSGLLSTLGDSVTVESKNYGYQVLFGIGTGMTMSSVTLMANLQSDPRDHAVTQGIVSQARVLGGSIGVAASTAMFNHQLLSKLAGVIPYEQLSQIQRSPHILEELSMAQLVEVRSVFADSFNASLRICTYVAAVGLVISVGTFQQNPPNIARRKAQIEELIIESRAVARHNRT